jgi:hypothetical protein
MWIKWALENWRLLIVFALAGVLFITGWHYGASSVQQSWDKERATQQADAMSAMTAHAEMIQTLEVQKNDNIAKIDSLAADNQRLRLRPPACIKPTDTSISTSTTPSSGFVQPTIQIPLDDFTIGVGSDFVRCDKIVESARVMSDYLKSLK